MDNTKYLLKAKEIDGLNGERKTHFLNPNAVRLNKSLGDEVGLSQIGVHLISIEPGRDSTEYHKHYFEEECIYVISGTGALIMNGFEFPISKGDFMGFPKNTVAHSMKNTGNETLVCLVMGQRLTHDVSDYPNLGKRLYRNNGEWNLVDITSVTDPRKK